MLIVNLGTINWSALRKQKLWLIANSENEDACGILHLIDHIQDQAVANNLATWEEVFGPPEPEGSEGSEGLSGIPGTQQPLGHVQGWGSVEGGARPADEWEQRETEVERRAREATKRAHDNAAWAAAWASYLAKSSKTDK